jgi:anti-sigma factor RsiW
VNCRAALDQLLEADSAVLAGLGETELADHVRACPRCAAAAAAMLRTQASLQASLDAVRPRVPVEMALGRAQWRRPSWRRRWWIAAAPVAAAAGIAAIILLSRSVPTPVPTQPPATQATAERPIVTAPAGHNVAVFQTDDPNIVIVWIL